MGYVCLENYELICSFATRSSDFRGRVGSIYFVYNKCGSGDGNIRMPGLVFVKISIFNPMDLH